MYHVLKRSGTLYFGCDDPENQEQATGRGGRPRGLRYRGSHVIPENTLTDISEVVTRRPLFTLEDSRYSFVFEAESASGPSAA